MEKNKTIAEIIFGEKPYDNITNYITIYNKKKKNIYTEYFDGSWYKTLYNEFQRIYFETSNGYIKDHRPKPNKTIAEIIFGEKPNSFKTIFNKNKYPIYCEDNDGFWSKRLYNNQGEQIYFETSNGYIKDHRPKPNKTIAEIIFGEKPDKFKTLYNKNKDVYNKNKDLIYFEEFDGFWSKRLYNNQEQQIYYENSLGRIIDNRPKLNKLKSFFRSIFNLFK